MTLFTALHTCDVSHHVTWIKPFSKWPSIRRRKKFVENLILHNISLICSFWILQPKRNALGQKKGEKFGISHPLKEKQMECIWRITRLEGDVLVVFTTGFDKRHDSESDKIVSPHWVPCIFQGIHNNRQQVENLKNTHWRTESVLNLRWFFFKKKVPDD